MLPLDINVLAAVPFAQVSDAMTLGLIIGTAIAVVVSAAIPLTTGVAKGHVALGIVGALVVLPIAALFGCIGGLPTACMFAALITIIPAPKKPLLSQAEIEAEMRRARGY
jgi:hypothetical protein